MKKIIILITLLTTAYSVFANGLFCSMEFGYKFNYSQIVDLHTAPPVSLLEKNTSNFSNIIVGYVYKNIRVEAEQYVEMYPVPNKMYFAPYLAEYTVRGVYNINLDTVSLAFIFEHLCGHPVQSFSYPPSTLSRGWDSISIKVSTK